MKAEGGVVFEHVTKRYNDVPAVSDVSFEVRPGQLVTLLGPSGCGKTTTLRMVAGLEPVTTGRIFIGGNDDTKRAANERDVSMVFQSYALFPHMNVLDNVCYGPMSMRMDKAKARALAEAKLSMLGLNGLEARLPLNCRVVSSSAWPSHARSCSSPPCCCSTNRCRTSTPSCVAASGRRFASCSNRST